MPVLQPSVLLVILVTVTLGAAAPLDDPRLINLSRDTFRRLKPAGEDVVVDIGGFGPLQGWKTYNTHKEHRLPHKTSHHKHQHHKHNLTQLHHKIHNPIAKLPPAWLKKHHVEPKESCISAVFSQKVHMEGCETRYVLNRYCLGACTSIFIPGSDQDQDLDNYDPRSKKLQAEFENCTFCRPAETEDISVPLHCDDGELRTRKIVRIKRCECMNRNELPFRR